MPTQNKKVVGQDDKEESLVHSEWRDFSKTLAYKRMMEYAHINGDMLIRDAKDMTMTVGKEKVSISPDMSNLLLQRSAGIDIMTSYIRIYSE